MIFKGRKILTWCIAGLLLFVFAWVFWPVASWEDFQLKCHSIVPGMEVVAADVIMADHYKKIRQDDKENIVYFKSKKWFDFTACSVFLEDGMVTKRVYIFD